MQSQNTKMRYADAHTFPKCNRLEATIEMKIFVHFNDFNKEK